MCCKVPVNATTIDITSSISYGTGQSITDLGPISTYIQFNDSALVPSEPVPQPKVTKSIDLVMLFDTMNDGTNRAMINDVIYDPPLVPAVFSELSLGPNATVQEAYGPYSYLLDYLDVVDLVVKNMDSNHHPLYVFFCLRFLALIPTVPMRSHLHGHKFQIVNRVEQLDSNDPALNPPLIEGQPNPMRRDTATIPAGGSLTLRFVADNPGAWIFHCQDSSYPLVTN